MYETKTEEAFLTWSNEVSGQELLILVGISFARRWIGEKSCAILVVPEKQDDDIGNVGRKKGAGSIIVG